MLRQIERWLQNRPTKKNGVLPVTTLLFKNFCFSLWTIKSWFDVITTQMSIFVFFVSAQVLFDGVFSLWVSFRVVAVLINCGNQKDQFLKSLSSGKDFHSLREVS